MQFELLEWNAPGSNGGGSPVSTREYERCTVCGRSLSSPAARAAGMGPVCARRSGVSLGVAAVNRSETMRAVFSFQVAHGVLCIVDTGNGNSVTNDADRVIQMIGQQIDLSAVRGVIYRDTRGIWDEMILKDGEFRTFRSINAEDRDEAIVALKRRDRPVLMS